MKNTVIFSDALTALKTLPDDLVQVVVTSPPYWAMRDYDNHRQWFDESRDPCAHDLSVEHGPHHPGQVEETKWKKAEGAGKGQTALTHSCSKCGAWYGQLGQEPELRGYIKHMVEIFREVRRVLRVDGSMWLNLGDTFKDKRLQLVPYLVATALQEDGWLLRSVVQWHKISAKPESVRDRPVRSHEPIFLMTKSEKYFYDHEAVKEPTADEEGLRSMRDVWSFAYKPLTRVKYEREANFAVFPTELPKRCIKASSRKGDLVLDIFAGSGTTLGVAKSLGRDYLGIEVNSSYSNLIERRIDSLGGSLPMDLFDEMGSMSMAEVMAKTPSSA